MSLNATRKNVQLIPKLEGHFSLDAGCGKGVYLSYFRRDVVALDISRQRIKGCKAKGASNIFHVIGDIRSLPFKSKVFDYLLSLDVIEHLNDYDLDVALSEFERVTNGVMHVGTPNCNFIQELLRKITLASLFDVEHMSKMERDSPNRHKSTLTEKRLEQYGFQVNGCLGWVTAQIIKVGFVNKCYDLLVCRHPRLAGSIIGTKRC